MEQYSIVSEDRLLFNLYLVSGVISLFCLEKPMKKLLILVTIIIFHLGQIKWPETMKSVLIGGRIKETESRANHK